MRRGTAGKPGVAVADRSQSSSTNSPAHASLLTFAVTRRLPRRPVRSRGIYGDRAELRQRP